MRYKQPVREHADRYLAGAVVVAAALIGLALGKPAPAPSGSDPISAPIGESISPTGTEPDRVTVHVSGEVVIAGLVQVDRDDRIADAVAAAGGVTAAADLERINLASPVSDGQQIIVPRADGARADSGGRSNEGDGRLHLNTADAAALESLPGVGPVLAEKIVSYRDRFGAFETVEDLLGVSGIGEQKLAGFRDALIVP